MNTRTFLFMALLFSITLALFSQCKKEYSYEGGGGTVPDTTINPPSTKPADASFTFVGAPVNCTNAKINGTYEAHSAFNSSNYVIVSVNVITVGNYHIYTDTLDGVSFSNAGTFTKTGTQQVTLLGSGTPDFARDLTFTPHTPASGCTFSLTVFTPGPPATYVLESNQDKSCINYTVAGDYKTGVALSATNTVLVKVYVTNPGNFTIATNTANGILFSFTGTFTNAGSQWVTLTGSGTPQTPGTFTFTPKIVGAAPLGGPSCTFAITVN